MAIIGAQIAAKWYKPFEDDDAEYLIKPLNNTAYANVFIAHADMLTGNIDGDGLMIAFMHGVEDWKKVFMGKGESDGKEAPRTVASVEQLPRQHFFKVANRILDISSLGADELKNS